MEITLLCNAGLAITYEGKTLLVDIPNSMFPPFASMAPAEWQSVVKREGDYGSVCGLYFTHDHPDHCDMEKVRDYKKRWPEIPCFVPEETTAQSGTLVIGPFVVSYMKLDHAPMDVPTPPHVVTWVRAGEKSIYIAADAKLDCEEHRRFIKGRVANAAFWNAMYLSRKETRKLIHDTAQRNFIYHMPQTEPDGFGIWKKCRNNLQRYGDELQSVQVLDKYPYHLKL